jgi:hypothetical protein
VGLRHARQVFAEPLKRLLLRYCSPCYSAANASPAAALSRACSAVSRGSA